MGKISSGIKCSVSGCVETAIRSISSEKDKDGGLNVPAARVYLCKNHYKELKKKNKKEKEIEKWRWMK